MPNADPGVPTFPPDGAAAAVGLSRSNTISAPPFRTTDVIPTLTDVFVKVHGWRAVVSGLLLSPADPVSPVSVRVQVAAASPGTAPVTIPQPLAEVQPAVSVTQVSVVLWPLSKFTVTRNVDRKSTRLNSSHIPLSR